MVQGAFRNLFVNTDYKIVNLATPSKENPYNLKLLHLAYIMLFGEEALTPSFQSTFGGWIRQTPQQRRSAIMVTHTSGRARSIHVETKTRRTKSSFWEVNYRRTVKVAFFLIFLMTFSLIVLLSRLLSALYFVLEYAIKLLRKVNLIEAEETQTEPRSEIDRERRKYPRFNVYWPVRFNQIRSSVRHDGRVTNLSEGGMLIQSSEQIEVGQHLNSKVSFILGSEINTIEMLAEVVRRGNGSGKAMGDYQCGAKFLDISPGDKDKLNDLLMSLSPTLHS